MTHRIRILLVDDVAMVRHGLRMRLGREPDLQIVGEAEDGMQAIERALALRPDIVLLDVGLPGQDGIAVASQLQTLAPDSAVVMLSLYDDAITRARARAAGAVALVGKHEPLPALLAAIRQTAPSKGDQPGRREASVRRSA